MVRVNLFGVTKSHWIKVVVLMLAMLVAFITAFTVLADTADAKKKKRTASVTRTFGSLGVTINDDTTATPYPAQTNVRFKDRGPKVQDLNVSLLGYSHTFPDDVDVLLASPGGQCAIIMSDAGGIDDAINLNLTFDDAAAASLPDNTQLSSGTFKPSNYLLGGMDNFPPPAPNPATCGSTLTAFNGVNPNGAWKLYVSDDIPTGTGSIGGFSLQIKAKVNKKR